MNRVPLLLLFACTLDPFTDLAEQAPVRRAEVTGSKRFLNALDAGDDANFSAQVISASTSRELERIRLGTDGGITTVPLSDYNQSLLDGDITSLVNWKNGVFLLAANDSAETQASVWKISSDTLQPIELTFALRSPGFATDISVASDGNDLIAAGPTATDEDEDEEADAHIVASESGTNVQYECLDFSWNQPQIAGGVLNVEADIRGFVVTDSEQAAVFASADGSCIELKLPEQPTAALTLRNGQLAALADDHVLACDLSVETKDDDLTAAADCHTISQTGDSLTFIDLFGDGEPELAIGSHGAVYVYAFSGDLVGAVRDPDASDDDELGLSVAAFTFAGAQPREELAVGGKGLVSLFLRTGLSQSDGTIDCDPRSLAPAGLSCE